MKKYLLLLLAISLVIPIAAPGAKNRFAVEKADSRFSQSKNEIWVSKNNRISKRSVAGGIHIDRKGVYLDPFVEKTRSGKIVALGFNIMNWTAYSTSYGRPNSLGRIQKVAFALDSGDPIVLKLSGQEIRTSDVSTYNTITRSAGHDVSETATGHISKTDFQRLINTRDLACQIVGTERSVVYEKKRISKYFLENLRSFYKSHVQ